MPRTKRSPRSAPHATSRASEGRELDRTPDASFVVAEGTSAALDGALRALSAISWNEARARITTGKVFVGGVRVLDPRAAVRAGDVIEVFLRAPRPEVERVRSLESSLFAYVDAHVAVVRKPAGVSTIPFPGEPDEGDTLDAIVREALVRRARAEGRSIAGRAPLGVVQRLDKGTSGLLVFARTVAAKQALTAALRVHAVHRAYLAIAHGRVRAQTVRSHLVADRGDGLRGSIELARLRGSKRALAEGQLATTRVEPVESLEGATLVRCTLETGRTHQIRIHLAEAGHPLVGESVYIRGHEGPRIEAPRVMLHAAELGFEHPATGRPMRFGEPPPEDFERVLRRLRVT